MDGGGQATTWGALERYLGSVSKQTFFADYLEQKYLHVKSALALDAVESLLSSRDIARIFESLPLYLSRVQVIRNGVVDREPRLHAAGGIDPEFVAEQYEQGASLRITDAQYLVPAVNAACEALARDCGCGVFANIYMTPKGNPGFNPHYDDHDVLIVQAHGSKSWSIHDEYANKREVPLLGDKFDPTECEPGPASHEFVLDIGDVLYIPRGHMHSARSGQSGSSVHITFSLNWVTWNELAFDLLAQAVLSDVRYRRSIVGDLVRGDGADVSALLQTLFPQMSAGLTTAADVESSYARLSERFEDMYLRPRAPAL